MKKALLGIAVALLALSAFPVIELGMWLRESRLDQDKIAAVVQGWDLPTKNALAQIAATGKTLSQVAAKERNAFGQQAGYYQQLTAKSGAVLDSLNSTILEVRNDTLPRVDRSIDSATGVFGTVDTSARILGSKGVDTLNDVETAIRNPDIGEAISGIRDTSLHSAEATKNLAQITVDGRTLVHYEVNEIMKPVKKVETVFRFAIRTVGIFFGY